MVTLRQCQINSPKLTKVKTKETSQIVVEGCCELQMPNTLCHFWKTLKIRVQGIFFLLTEYKVINCTVGASLCGQNLKMVSQVHPISIILYTSFQHKCSQSNQCISITLVETIYKHLLLFHKNQWFKQANRTSFSWLCYIIIANIRLRGSFAFFFFGFSQFLFNSGKHMPISF